MIEISSPFPPEDIPRIWGWIEPFRWRVSDDFSPKTLPEFIAYYRAQSERSTTWAVYRTIGAASPDDLSAEPPQGGRSGSDNLTAGTRPWSSELGGAITYEQVSPIVGTAHCVFKKSFWGRKTTRPALEAAIAQMFERCSKLSLPVMEGNKAMLSLLAELGASKEGVLERHTMRDGKPVSLVMMALFKDKFGKQEEKA